MQKTISLLQDIRAAITGKTTPIIRIAYRETSVSRHHVGPTEGPPEVTRTITTLYHSEGLEGALYWAKKRESLGQPT